LATQLIANANHRAMAPNMLTLSLPSVSTQFRLDRLTVKGTGVCLDNVKTEKY